MSATDKNSDQTIPEISNYIDELMKENPNVWVIVKKKIYRWIRENCPQYSDVTDLEVKKRITRTMKVLRWNSANTDNTRYERGDESYVGCMPEMRRGKGV